MESSDLDLFVTWDETFTDYDFGPSHPMHPLRLDLTAKLATDFGLFDHPRITVSAVGGVDEAELAKVHTRGYVDAVKEAGETTSLDEVVPAGVGVGTEDVPRFEKIHEASGRIFQAGVEAARAVAGGGYDRAVNFCGGMHHAMSDRASGFCVYNDIAATITTLLENGYRARRVHRLRRPPRRRSRTDLLGRPPRPHAVRPRERPLPLPRHRLRERHRRDAGGRLRRQRRTAARARTTRTGCARSMPSCPTCCGSSIRRSS